LGREPYDQAREQVTVLVRISNPAPATPAYKRLIHFFMVPSLCTPASWWKADLELSLKPTAPTLMY
jgi:hypothetical protein